MPVIERVSIQCQAWIFTFAWLISGVGATEANELPSSSDWHYGAYLDLNYAANFNTSEPHAWRNKLTTHRLSTFSPDMGLVYVSKTATEDSRWGVELGGQGGYDTGGQVPATGKLGGADILQYVAHANLSYLAPIGNGVKLVGGLFNSFIGYESMYAKDNFNYTRGWIADYSPYFLIGGGAQYPVNDQIDVGLYLVTDYDYLNYTNSQPKYAWQSVWRVNPNLKLMQNAFVGPEQTQTAFQYWRGFLNTMVEWSESDYTLALVYDIGSERNASSSAHTQDLWMGSALFTRWNVSGPWTVAVRPELYWDPNGTMTGSIQFIKAITSTLEYKVTDGEMTGRIRLEYRYDNSTGKQGGFYGAGGENGPLVAGQSTLFCVLLLNLDH